MAFALNLRKRNLQQDRKRALKKFHMKTNQHNGGNDNKSR